MNWYILTAVGVFVVLLIIYLVRANIKDEKKFEEGINKNYPHSTDSPKDIDIEEPMH